MNQISSSIELLALSDLPKLLKQRVQIPQNAKDKSNLDAVLVSMLTEFFSRTRLKLEHDSVLEALEDTRTKSVEMVLAKLRSLLEKQARRDIGEFCGSLTRAKRRAFVDALHEANIHHFRENIETDLYVGIHTAISANFKMIGVVYSNPEISQQQRPAALSQLFRALSSIAAQPLGVLLAFEGLFWDRGLYCLPQSITWRDDGAQGLFYLHLADIEGRLSCAIITEIPLGCPAMRTRTFLGERAIDFVQQRCVAVAERYCETAAK